MSATDRTLEGTPRALEPARVRLAVLSGNLLFGVLLLALATTPFEIGYPPLGRLLWTTYTNLEVTLFAVAAAWLFHLAVDGAARRRLLSFPLLLPLGALVAALILSTIFGEYRLLGVQTLYRTLMGVLVGLAVWEAFRNGRRLLVALLVVAGTAAVSAAMGLLEFAPQLNIESWLRVFKPQPTTVGGMLRLSGTFEYANGAAGYFELVVPLLLGLLAFFAWDQGQKARRVGSRTTPVEPNRPESSVLSPLKGRLATLALYVVLALCAMALLLTYSRAAWLSVGVSLFVFGLGLWARRSGSKERGFSPLWRAVGLAAGVIFVGALYLYATQPLLRLRLLGENDRDWYSNTIVSGQVPAIIAGETITVPVRVSNEGPTTWQAQRAPTVHLSYHWRIEGSPTYEVFEGVRTALPHDIEPGETVTLRARLRAPKKPGAYLLEWDMVQEKVAWFRQKNLTEAELIAVKVREIPAGYTPPPPPPADPFTNVNVSEVENYDSSTVSRGQLWRVAWEMFKANPITGVGPDGFRNLYGKYAGVETWNRNVYTNSTYIEMFTNLGLVGGMAFLWLAGLALWKAIRNVLHAPISGEWLLRLGATAGLITFLLHGFVDYYLFSTPLYVTFWLVTVVSMGTLGVKRQA